MAKPSDAALKAALKDLPPDELARLPGRLRALTRVDAALDAWSEAKRERDQAIAAHTERVEEERLDAHGSPYVVVTERYSNPDAVAAAKARWEGLKPALLAQMEG